MRTVSYSRRSPSPLPVAAHRSYRTQAMSRLLTWRRRYSKLMLDATRTSPRYRQNLTRHLVVLAGHRDRVLHLLDDLSTARAERQWEETRRRAEAAWAELDATTDKLLRQVTSQIGTRR